MVRFRTRLVAVTCAVAMVGSFWGSAGAIVSADASEPSAEMAWSITTDKLVFDTGADAKWTDKIYASNDEGTYPELGRIDDVSVGKKAVLTANVTLNGDFSGLDGAEAADGTYNAIQLSCAIKTGDGWTYTKSDDYPFLKAENFTDGKTQVSFAFDVEDTGAVNEIIFQYNSNSAYTGTISISDVEIQSDDSGEEPDGGKEPDGGEEPGGGSSATGNVTGVAAPSITDNTVWSSSDAVLTFDATSDATWKDKAYASNDSDTYADMARIEGATVGEKAKLTATVSLDGDISGLDGAEASDGSYNAIQLACAMKTGDSWDYVKSGDYPFIKAENFVDGKCDISFAFDVSEVGNVQEIVFQYNSNSAYAGKITISNVKVLDVKESSGGLEQRDPAVISDLSSAEDYDKWSTEAGYAYKHGDAANKAGNATPDISYDSANERLKVSVDYSADSTSSWSEAKVKCVPTEAMDVSQYNQLSVDIIYPAKLKGSKLKFFADGIINKDTTIDDDAEDIGDGLKKVTVTMGFTPTDKPLTDVTIGIIGSSTSFKGNVYLDNLVLSQADTTKDFVEITETPGAGSPVDLSQMPSSVRVSDANAADSAKALAAYLNTLMNSDQVLFGHQNDVSRSVNPQASLGDVYDARLQRQMVRSCHCQCICQTSPAPR